MHARMQNAVTETDFEPDGSRRREAFARISYLMLHVTEKYLGAVEYQAKSPSEFVFKN